MSSIVRKSVNFRPGDAQLLTAFLEDDSPELRTLADVSGETLTSDASSLRALVLLGARQVRDEMARRSYDEAVASGAFEDSDRSLGRRRRGRRPSSTDG